MGLRCILTKLNVSRILINVYQAVPIVKIRLLLENEVLNVVLKSLIASFCAISKILVIIIGALDA